MANSYESSVAVEAHDLVKVFPRGNVRALDGVSLQIETGTVLGLLGPNGAGKTTAVRILSTILEPDSGTATILGHDVVKEADVIRRIIGLAGQYATVDENLTGRENLRMIGRLSHLSRKVAADQAAQLLDSFALHDAADRPLKTYSGGMRRRLDLAAALVASPPVLFLDEPTTGLDPSGRQDLWAVIEELTAEGTTVLLTTQYLEEADRLARDIVVVDHGTVIAQGTPAQLKADLGTSVVAVTLLGDEEVRARRAVARSTHRPGAHHRRHHRRVDRGERARRRRRSPALARRRPDRGGWSRLAGTEPRRRVSEPDWPQDRSGDGRGPGGTQSRPAPSRRRDRRKGRGVTTLALPKTIEHPVERKQGSRLSWTIQDTLTVTWRNIIALSRNQQTIVFSAIQPIMFVLLFVYVFGGAIHIPGVPYVDFLIPGVYVQTVTFGAVSTAVGLSEDLHKGLIERFRALPMARSAVLAGRTTADLLRNVFVVILITAVGFAVGFRIGTNFGLFICGALIVLLFSYTLCWGFATIGLSAPNAEAAQTMVFPILFPFIFASSAFVPVSDMPGWLQAFAKNQPVTQVVDACRSLMTGGPLHDTGAVWASLAWCFGLLIVLAPLAVHKYRRVA